MGVVMQQKSAARRGGAPDGPDVIFGANLVAWYDSETVTLNGSDVSAMSDLSGMATNLIQASASLQPAYSAGGGLNGRSKVTFDGVDDRMDASGGTNRTIPYHIFFVFEHVDFQTGVDNRLFHSNGAFNGMLRVLSGDDKLAMSNATNLAGNVADNDPHYLSLLYKASPGSVLRQDGVDLISGNAGANGIIPLTIGNGGNAANFDFYSFALVDREATTDERDAMETYMKDRYGL